MNFLEACKIARLISGIQGQGPSSVTGASGIEAVIVQFVKEGFVDIQNLRPNFNFMKKTKTFTTTIGKSNYTLSDIFVSGADLKSYKMDSFLITDGNGQKRYLVERDDEVLQRLYLNDVTQNLPGYVAIESDKSLTLKPTPDGVYTVSFDYYRTPQILATDAEIPILPVEFHQLIVYKAVEKLAVYLTNPEVYSGYSTEAMRMVGQVMRQEIPPMKPKRRPMGGIRGRRR